MKLPLQVLEARGKELLREIDEQDLELVQSEAAIGGGSAPGQTFPSHSLVLPAKAKPETLLRRLRSSDPPIIGIVSQGRVCLNLATIDETELPLVAHTLKHILRDTGA